MAMMLNGTIILELLRERPGRYIWHDMGQYRMKEANGADVTVTEDGRECVIEPVAAQMDDLMDASRLIRDRSTYRAKVEVSRFKVWSQQAGDFIVSRRYATRSGIARAGGEAIAGTEIEIDSKDLEPEGWTAKDYTP
jgi:hypothetical protein